MRLKVLVLVGNRNAMEDKTEGYNSYIWGHEG